MLSSLRSSSSHIGLKMLGSSKLTHMYCRYQFRKMHTPSNAARVSFQSLKILMRRDIHLYVTHSARTGYQTCISPKDKQRKSRRPGSFLPSEQKWRYEARDDNVKSWNGWKLKREMKTGLTCLDQSPQLWIERSRVLRLSYSFRNELFKIDYYLFCAGCNWVSLISKVYAS